MRRSDHPGHGEPGRTGETAPLTPPGEPDDGAAAAARAGEWAAAAAAERPPLSQPLSQDERAWKRAEARVIEQARLGDPRAFEILWMRFEPKIHVFFRRMCRHYRVNPGNDVWGEVYLAVAGSLATFDPAKARSSTVADPGMAFCSWAYRIAARVAIGQVIRERRVADVEVSVDNWESLPETVIADPRGGPDDRLFQREAVAQIYDKLSAAEGNPIRAEYLRLVAEGTPQQEAAALVGINPSTGRSWLNRFRSDLETGRKESAKA